MTGLSRPHALSAPLEIDEDLRGRFLDPRTHVEVLAPLSARHRRRGNARAAFAFADRYCRLTDHRDAHGLLLRAEARADLGDREGCRADVEASFEVDPMLPGVARRLLALAPETARLDIARLVLSNPRSDRDSRLDAIETVLAQGFDVVSELRYDGHAIHGSLAWDAAEHIAFSFAADEDARWSLIKPETTHRRGARNIAIAFLPSLPLREPDMAGATMQALPVRADQGVLSRPCVMTDNDNIGYNIFARVVKRCLVWTSTLNS